MAEHALAGASPQFGLVYLPPEGPHRVRLVEFKTPGQDQVYGRNPRTWQVDRSSARTFLGEEDPAGIGDLEQDFIECGGLSPRGWGAQRRYATRCGLAPSPGQRRG